jgi:hypothetical protein
MTRLTCALLFVVFISFTLGGLPSRRCAESNVLSFQPHDCDDLIVVQRSCEACTGKIEIDKTYFDLTSNYNNNKDDKFLYFYSCVSNNHMMFDFFN